MAWHSERKFCACLCPLINSGVSKISLTCSFSDSYHIESQRMFQNQVEREREREIDLESSRKRKRREDRARSGIRGWGGEKTREKKKKKKRKKKRMDEIKKRKII